MGYKHSKQEMRSVRERIAQLQEELLERQMQAEKCGDVQAAGKGSVFCIVHLTLGNSLWVLGSE